MHKVARYNGHAHHKHPYSHAIKKNVSKRAKHVMPLLLAQYKKAKNKPFISAGVVVAIGIGLLSTVLIWLNRRK